MNMYRYIIHCKRIHSDTHTHYHTCTQVLLSQLKKANELEEKLEESNKKILVSS